MKIRIKDDTVRFRLSEPEVNRLAGGEPVKSKTHFPGNILQVEILPAVTTDIHFANSTILLKLAKDLVTDWAGTDRVSIETEMVGSNGRTLSVLIEKDFKCLTRDPQEEQDLYPNPNTHHNC